MLHWYLTQVTTCLPETSLFEETKLSATQGALLDGWYSTSQHSDCRISPGSLKETFQDISEGPSKRTVRARSFLAALWTAFTRILISHSILHQIKLLKRLCVRLAKGYQPHHQSLQTDLFGRRILCRSTTGCRFQLFSQLPDFNISDPGLNHQPFSDP